MHACAWNNFTCDRHYTLGAWESGGICGAVMCDCVGCRGLAGGHLLAIVMDGLMEMDGWMDGWMDEWIDEWINGSIDGWIDE